LTNKNRNNCHYLNQKAQTTVAPNQTEESKKLSQKDIIYGGVVTVLGLIVLAQA
jgi:hypothetical protein